MSAATGASTSARDSSPTTFGQEIRRIRKLKNITLMDLSDRMDWSISYQHDIEKGRRNVPRVKDVHRLIKALDCQDQAERLLELAAYGRGHVRIDLDSLSPEVARLTWEFARLIERGLDEPYYFALKEAIAFHLPPSEQLAPPAYASYQQAMAKMTKEERRICLC